jgi:hypothetical protein
VIAHGVARCFRIAIANRAIDCAVHLGRLFQIARAITVLRRTSKRIVATMFISAVRMRLPEAAAIVW